MSVRQELRKILKIIAAISQNNTNTNVRDDVIIMKSGRPKHKVNRYFGELVSRALIEEEFGIRSTGADFRLFHITQKGLEELEDESYLR